MCGLTYCYTGFIKQTLCFQYSTSRWHIYYNVCRLILIIAGSQMKSKYYSNASLLVARHPLPKPCHFQRSRINLAYVSLKQCTNNGYSENWYNFWLIGAQRILQGKKWQNCRGNRNRSTNLSVVQRQPGAKLAFL